MKNCTIGIIDSGAGGAYLEKLIKENFSKEEVLNIIRYKSPHFRSYSNVSIQKLCMISQEHIDYIYKEYVPDIIIVACMTLSSNCLEFIRSIVMPQTIVLDMLSVLPYLHNNTTIFATPNTIKSGRFDYCLQVPCATLSTLIEREESELVININLKDAVNKFNIIPTSTILLGCSHYSKVKHCFQDVFTPDEIIDPIELIMKQLDTIVKTS